MKTDFDIKALTSFKIGGKITKVFFPESVDEFLSIMREFPEAKVFGNLSNTLVSSFGYDGILVLTTKMNNIDINGAEVVVDCGVKGPMLSKTVQPLGLSGFEFMIGFPGSVGGNICMNASANGQCISDCLKSVTCFIDGDVKQLSKEEMMFGYRTSICQRQNIIVLQARFELAKSTPQEVSAQMENNLLFRKQHQPSLALPNCGSIFRNPEGDSAGRLLDAVGAKSMSAGGVKVWEHHANFIVNTQNGTSCDVLELMCMMSDAVQEKFNVKLLPEIRFLGNNNEKEENLCSKLKIK